MSDDIRRSSLPGCNCRCVTYKLNTLSLYVMWDHQFLWKGGVSATCLPLSTKSFIAPRLLIQNWSTLPSMFEPVQPFPLGQINKKKGRREREEPDVCLVRTEGVFSWLRQCFCGHLCSCGDLRFRGSGCCVGRCVCRVLGCSSDRDRGWSGGGGQDGRHTLGHERRQERGQLGMQHMRGQRGQTRQVEGQERRQMLES